MDLYMVCCIAIAFITVGTYIILALYVLDKFE